MATELPYLVDKLHKLESRLNDVDQCASEMVEARLRALEEEHRFLAKLAWRHEQWINEEEHRREPVTSTDTKPQPDYFTLRELLPHLERSLERLRRFTGNLEDA